MPDLKCPGLKINAFHTSFTKTITMKKIFFAMLIAASFVACKKDSTPAPTCTLTETSIQATYKIESYKDASNNDLFIAFPACIKDDTYQFAADGAFNFTDAGTVCTAVPPGPNQNSWALTTNNTILSLDIQNSNFPEPIAGDFKVESFDCTRLVVSITPGFNTIGKETITFLKQ
jgi:hypothetical protein